MKRVKMNSQYLRLFYKDDNNGEIIRDKYNIVNMNVSDITFIVIEEENDDDNMLCRIWDNRYTNSTKSDVWWHGIKKSGIIDDNGDVDEYGFDKIIEFIDMNNCFALLEINDKKSIYINKNNVTSISVDNMQTYSNRDINYITIWYGNGTLSTGDCSADVMSIGDNVSKMNKKIISLLKHWYDFSS